MLTKKIFSTFPKKNGEKSFLIPLLEEGGKRWEIRQDVHPQAVALMIMAIIDRFLQSYLYHILPQSTTDNLEQDLTTLIEILKSGLLIPEAKK